MMKAIALVLYLYFFAISVQASSIYKCTQKNGDVIFMDKPCPKDTEEAVIHKETEEEAKAKALRKKLKKINYLIRNGENEKAKLYAAEHNLDVYYKESVEVYNQKLDQALKEEELNAKKQEQAIRKQEILIQQRLIELERQQLEQQKQQLEQQKQQTEAAKALTKQKRKTRDYYFYPYMNNNCQQNGIFKNCQPMPYNWRGKNIYNKKKPLKQTPQKKEPAKARISNTH